MALWIKRIYEAAEDDDGVRLLVDRLWPRGVSREAARLDGWVKALAPSAPLRVWFGHRAENFERFCALYRAELDANIDAQEAARQVILQSREGTVTLLYAAKDPQVNHAAVLRDYLEEKSDEGK